VGGLGPGLPGGGGTKPQCQGEKNFKRGEKKKKKEREKKEKKVKEKLFFVDGMVGSPPTQIKKWQTRARRLLVEKNNGGGRPTPRRSFQKKKNDSGPCLLFSRLPNNHQPKIDGARLFHKTYRMLVRVVLCGVFVWVFGGIR